MLATVFFETGGGKSPVLDYIDEQNEEGQAAIEAFAEEFPSVRTVSIKHLQSKLWELRVQRHRVLYAVAQRNLLLLHAFFKRTQKTPRRDIEIALERLRSMTRERV